MTINRGHLWIFGLMLALLLSSPVLGSQVTNNSKQPLSSYATTQSSKSAPVMGIVHHWWTPMSSNLTNGIGVKWIRTDVCRGPEFAQFLKNYSGDNFVGILDGQVVGTKIDANGCISGCSWSLTDWDRNVSLAAQDYSQIHVWEIWNEPQIAEYQSGYLSNVGSYFNLLKDAYQIIKAHNSSDTVLCLGGDNIYYGGYTTYSVPDYLWASSLWGLGASNYCDAISLHAYSAETYLLSDVPEDWTGHPGNETLGQIYVDALNAYGNLTNKPIWITETGLPSNNGTGYSTFAHVPEPSNTVERQAAFLDQSFILFMNHPDVRGVFWFDMIGLDDYQYAFDYGLFTTQEAPKPALVQLESFPNLNGTVWTSSTVAGPSSSTLGTGSTSGSSTIQSSTATAISVSRPGGLFVHPQNSQGIEDPLFTSQPGIFSYPLIEMPLITFAGVLISGYGILRKLGVYAST